MEARKVKIVTVALISAAVLIALSATAEAKNSGIKLTPPIDSVELTDHPKLILKLAMRLDAARS